MPVRMVDLINSKRSGNPLSGAEIRWLVNAYVAGQIPDYQMSAFAMAVCLQGMHADETTELTMAMAESGDQLSFADMGGRMADKHSTGGVGDTTTLVLAPLVAAAGAQMAKMSGRGLGHTGGTIDKLESIPGFRCDLTIDDLRAQVRRVGLAVAAQTANLAPADKQLYALRDVTATVQSLPLIASSIMSKKLASGADIIVLDVKVGEGAFMKTIDEARSLARTMVTIGERAGRRVRAVLTSMEEPLGFAVGNALEVREAILTLRGEGPPDLVELCLALGAQILVAADLQPDAAAARAALAQSLQDGSALRKFGDWVRAQGGDERVVDHLELLPQAPVIAVFAAPNGGVIQRIHAESVGLVAMRLGAGRTRVGGEIDPAAGVVLHHKSGQSVAAGDALATVHAASTALADAAVEQLRACFEIAAGEPFSRPLVLETVAVDSAGDGQRMAADPAGAALIAQAQVARASAYAPYSHFAVGAALRLANGDVIHGANIENASYGLSNCAERTAVFRAVMTAGQRPQVVGIAVVADTAEPVAPCGACRQVLSEFCAPATVVWLANMNGSTRCTTVGELLPGAFTPADLDASARTSTATRE